MSNYFQMYFYPYLLEKVAFFPIKNGTLFQILVEIFRGIKPLFPISVFLSPSPGHLSESLLGMDYQPLSSVSLNGCIFTLLPQDTSKAIKMMTNEQWSSKHYFEGNTHIITFLCKCKFFQNKIIKKLTIRIAFQLWLRGTKELMPHGTLIFSFLFKMMDIGPKSHKSNYF